MERGVSVMTVTSQAEENIWVRETTDDGRTYYYNRATGASQWHIPNELYKSRCFETTDAKRKGQNHDDCIRMPASSRAVCGVDCVTERFDGGDSEESGDEEAGLSSALSEAEVAETCESEDSLSEEVAKPSMLLKVTIVSARGLADTDFMGGSKDKSDPYCTCEFIGKRSTQFRTPTLFDQLNPVWNFTHLMQGYTDSDSLRICVLDDDRTEAAVKNSKSLCRTESSGNIFTQTDDLLGSLTIPAEEVISDADAPREFPLEDDGDDEEAFVTVQTKLLQGYPALEGEPVSRVLRALTNVLGVNEDGTSPVLAVETPDEKGCAVASFDRLFKQSGYGGNFFGAFSDSTRKLRPGSVIELLGQQYTVAEIGAEGSGQRAAGKAVRYVHLTEAIRNGPVRDGTRWRKVTEKAEGEDPNRVVVVFDPATELVVGVPVFG